MTKEDRTLTSVNALLYIINKIEKTIDIRVIYKILYFGERDHLVKYGSSFTEEKFIAMSKGPVPELSRNIIQSISNKGDFPERKGEFSKYFEKEKKYFFRAKKEFDQDELSKSALESLDEVIKVYQNMTFKEISELSHGKAWRKTAIGQTISPFTIAEENGADEGLLRYMFELDRLKNADIIG